MLRKALFAAAAAALLASPVYAAPGGGHGAGASAGAGLGAGGGHMSGRGAARVDTPVFSGRGSGSINSNAPGTADRDLGLDRAAERRSAAGTLNSNNPRSATRATGTARADDRHDLNASTSVSREARVAEAYARWQRNHR